MTEENTELAYYGGKYLQPICFITEETNNSIKIDFDIYWVENHSKFEEVIVEFEHKTIQKIFSNDTNYECNTVIKITIDGLIGMEIPDQLSTDEDILNVMSNHINSFLAKLSIGGIHFSPIQYNQLEILELEGNKLSLGKTIANYKNYEDFTRNQFRENNLCLNSEHYRTVLFSEKNYDIGKLQEAYKNGHIVTNAFFTGSEYFFLEAYENYKQSKYGLALLSGWTLIEIIINKFWVEKFVKTNERLKIKKKCVISEKIKHLYKADILDETVFDDLEVLRITRNNLIHEGETPNRDNAGYILVAIKKLVKIFIGIDMKFNNPGWKFYGKWSSNN